MSLPWATRGLKIPCVDRNDRKGRSLAMASGLSCHKKPMNFSLWQNLPWQAQPIVRRRFRLTVD